MARIYGVFTPGQTLCQRFQSIISFNAQQGAQEMGTTFYLHFISEEIEDQRGEAICLGSHSSGITDCRDP